MTNLMIEKRQLMAAQLGVAVITATIVRADKNISLTTSRAKCRAGPRSLSKDPTNETTAPTTKFPKRDETPIEGKN